MSLTFDEVPFSSKIPVKLSKRPPVNWTIPFSLLVNGQARSGKGVALDQLIGDSYFNGILTILLFSALGFENLFAVINKHCKSRWKKQVELDPNKYKFALPACQCSGTIDSIWVIPNYVYPDMKTVEKFNKTEYWDSFEEYCDYYMKEFGVVEINSIEKKLLESFKLKKPESIITHDKLKIMKFTPPTSESKIPAFRQEMRKILEVAKTEHRLVIHSPAIYPTDHKGKVDKYSFVAEFLRYIQGEFCDDPLMNYIENGKNRWERANNAISIFVNELRACCPSSKLSGDPESSPSKREMYNFMPEKRHAKARVIADCQSPTDLFDGVRMQFSELKAFKRTTFALIGDENQKFFSMIENYCNSIFESWGFNKNSVPDEAKTRLLEQYNICRMGEIPDDRILFKLENGEYQLKKVKQALFHHKIDKTDSFTQISGIKWTLKRDVADEPKEKTKKSKVEKNDEYTLIEKMRVEKKSYPDIIKHFLDIDNEKGVTDSKWIAETKKNLSNKFNRWKSRRDRALT